MTISEPEVIVCPSRRVVVSGPGAVELLPIPEAFVGGARARAFELLLLPEAAAMVKDPPPGTTAPELDVPLEVSVIGEV